ncbi:choloylglycine hydrolase [Halioglobus sp. HI00S01]|uniref:linear amide C-N hydrolase n=1 Tax=Halioglobus sp. HI00S01 TaxID=1822214 RepID=UPI0007C25381|nr:choloylglycine hydrolase family protein [Halioglobus sp. HI00S01]KZX58351.1 choloylglycine hydrolase [Halioglobus sp. HI00S01]
MLFISKRNYGKTLALVIIALILGSQAALACTGIILRSNDGATVPARTMEFAFDIESNLLAIPAGTEIDTLVLDRDKTGFTFKAKYGFLGANGLDKPIVFDGMNTQGLYYGAFYFAGEAEFGTVSEENRDRAVSSEEMGNWILGQFATVDEVVAALPSIEVVGTYVEEIGGRVPFHYAVTDRTGAAVVIEYTKDGLKVHQNTVNAVTNNPTYDWHLTNLSNYVGLQPRNVKAIEVGSEIISPFGQGSGMLGLPGDMTSPTRFVRAVAFANSSLPSETVDEAIFKAFHILNVFDIPKGAIREADEDVPFTDYTLWTSAADTLNAIYYYKTYVTQAVESVNVTAVIDAITEPTVVEMESGFQVRDRTRDFSN